MPIQQENYSQNQLDLIKENYSYGTWEEFCEEFGISLEEHKITIYYDSSLTEGIKEAK